MLLLTTDPLLPFTLLLLSLVLALFSFSSFFHKSSFPFLSPSRLPQNLITHLLHSNNPSCRWPKVKVLPAVRGKRLPLTIYLPRPWVNRLPTLNWTASRRRRQVAIQVMSVLLSLTHGMIRISTSP